MSTTKIKVVNPNNYDDGMKVSNVTTLLPGLYSRVGMVPEKNNYLVL